MPDDSVRLVQDEIDNPPIYKLSSPAAGTSGKRYHSSRDCRYLAGKPDSDIREYTAGMAMPRGQPCRWCVQNDGPVVGGLDPDIEWVYITTHKRGGGSATRPAAHTDRDCQHLEGVEPVFEKPVGVMDDDHRVCKECAGAVERPGTPQPNALKDRLLETEPEEIGMAPRGERPGREVEDAD